jgi:hypothetical protein
MRVPHLRMKRYPHLGFIILSRLIGGVAWHQMSNISSFLLEEPVDVLLTDLLKHLALVYLTSITLRPVRLLVSNRGQAWASARC